MSTGKDLPARLLVQYVGFHDAPGRREYLLLAQFGEKVRRYTVWIAHAAFVKRQALLQDGPDICYRKLMGVLVGSELVGEARVPVTDADLARYREAQAPPMGRPHSRRIVDDATPAAEHPRRA
ncbi:MAG TPA: hypothetical protein VII13_09165 [Vicinamibacteria bacterium]|jgi:hypothetical protein